MSDIFTKAKRSKIMSSIKSRNTGIERKLATAMRKEGLRGFRYQKRMHGNPDFVFERQKVAVFCDGDFWHGYQFNRWKNKLAPFWLEKISANMKRDKKVNRKLKREGWKVVRFWGYEIRKDPLNCVKILKTMVR